MLQSFYPVSVTARLSGAKHHEAWQQSALNRREYAKRTGFPLKAFGKLAGEVQSRTAAAGTELLYRRCA